MAIPASSAAAVTSASRLLPPGWTTAVTPALARTSSPSRKGKKASDAATGGPFDRWNRSLDHWQQRGPIDVRRVAFGMDESELFGFLAEDGVTVELQGPFTEDVVDPDSGETVPVTVVEVEPKKSGGCC